MEWDLKEMMKAFYAYARIRVLMTDLMIDLLLFLLYKWVKCCSTIEKQILIFYKINLMLLITV